MKPGDWMESTSFVGWTSRRGRCVPCVLLGGLLAGGPVAGMAQATTNGSMEFEVNSVKRNVSIDPGSTSFDFQGKGDVLVGSRFAATGYVLAYCVYFAFGLDDYQEGRVWQALPDWATHDRFDIEARAARNATRDEMRTMLVGLLRERFKLEVHHETQEAPLYWLTLVKQGKTGSKLLPHSVNEVCGTDADIEGSAGSKPRVLAAWPRKCGELGAVASPTTPGLLRVGARGVTLDWIAGQLAGVGSLDRTVINRAGLSGTFDFVLEFAPHFDRPLPQGSPEFDENGVTFVQALREQLGLKLEPQKGAVDVLVIDHIERPSAN